MELRRDSSLIIVLLVMFWPVADACSQGPPLPKRRTLGDLLNQPADSMGRMVPNLPGVQVDERRAAAAGIRKLRPGKHLTLYTDLPASEEIDCLPEVFDQAFPQWCEYFRLSPTTNAQWRMTGFLMEKAEKKDRFIQAGLYPSRLPDFPHGYAINFDLWLYDQPSDYYRRHLLVHEGTHGFMNTLLGACGPPWYMEGTAELLATHRWHDRKLTLNYMPVNREEVPEWGRIRIIKDAFAARQAMSLKKIVEFEPMEYLETKAYAWSWGAAALLDGHPRYQPCFRQLFKHVTAKDFSDRFLQAMGDDWDRAAEEWQLLVAGLEYGYDIRRLAIDFTPGNPLPAAGTLLTVAADRGWQNMGVRLEAGAKYQLAASGRYQVADKPQVWWCEPGGVSIRYYQGRPLGVLLGAVRPDEPLTKGSSALLHPKTIGLSATLAPERSGTLYLKINDSAAELADNKGEVDVQIKAQ